MLFTMLLFLIGFIFLTILWLLKVSGLFKPISITITKPPFDQLTIVYKLHRGAYSKSSQFFKELCNYAPMNVKIGIYYDNPMITPVEKRRFAVGMIVNEINDNELIERMKENNYQIIHLPKFEETIYTTFPFKNILSMFIAVLRVPYRLSDYIQENKLEAHPFIEIYQKSLIHYVVPLNDCNGYYVPEAIDAN